MSWLPFYENNFLVPLYPNTKYPIFSPPVDPKTGEVRSDPFRLHADFKTEIDYLSRRPTNEFVLHCLKDAGYNVGALTGPQRDGRFLVVKDFDVGKKLSLPVEGARAWRRERISLLQAWNTRIQLTPSGGFHAFFYGRVDQVHEFVKKMAKKQKVDWASCLDMTRGSGGMVSVEPSTFNGSAYFHLDHGKTLILDVSNEVIPISLIRPDPVDDFLSTLGSKSKI
jgi:hypothetical protein